MKTSGIMMRSLISTVIEVLTNLELSNMKIEEPKFEAKEEEEKQQQEEQPDEERQERVSRIFRLPLGLNKIFKHLSRHQIATFKRIIP